MSRAFLPAALAAFAMLTIPGAGQEGASAGATDLNWWVGSMPTSSSTVFEGGEEPSFKVEIVADGFSQQLSGWASTLQSGSDCGAQVTGQSAEALGDQTGLNIKIYGSARLFSCATYPVPKITGGMFPKITTYEQQVRTVMDVGPITADLRLMPAIDDGGISMTQSGFQVAGPSPVVSEFASTLQPQTGMMLSREQLELMLPDALRQSDISFSKASVNPSSDGSLHLIVEGVLPKSILDAYEIQNGQLVRK